MLECRCSLMGIVWVLISALQRFLFKLPALLLTVRSAQTVIPANTTPGGHFKTSPVSLYVSPLLHLLLFFSIINTPPPASGRTPANIGFVQITEAAASPAKSCSVLQGLPKGNIPSLELFATLWCLCGHDFVHLLR